MAQPNPIPTFSAAASATDFFQGAALPFQALALITRSTRLRRLALLSAVVTFISIVLLVWVLVSYSGALLGWFWPFPEPWWARGAWYLAQALLFLILFVVGMNTVPLALQSPLQDPLSEATEELCGAFAAPGFSVGGLVKGASLGIAYTLGSVLLLLLGHALLFPLNFIPGIGNLLWTGLSALWTALWAAAEHLGGPMARHLYPFREIRVVLRKRRALALGFGAAVSAILWVPVLNLFFVPLAIVGGTLLFRGLLQAGVLPPPPAAAQPGR